VDTRNGIREFSDEDIRNGCVYGAGIGAGSLAKGLPRRCWPAEADGRKPPHGLQRPDRAETAKADSPPGAPETVGYLKI